MCLFLYRLLVLLLLLLLMLLLQVELRSSRCFDAVCCSLNVLQQHDGRQLPFLPSMQQTLQQENGKTRGFDMGCCCLSCCCCSSSTTIRCCRPSVARSVS